MNMSNRFVVCVFSFLFLRPPPPPTPPNPPQTPILSPGSLGPQFVGHGLNRLQFVFPLPVPSPYLQSSRMPCLLEKTSDSVAQI